MDLYKILLKTTGSNIPIKSIKSHSRENEIDEMVSDTSNIRKLGWKPKIGLEEGIAMTLDWYLANQARI